MLLLGLLCSTIGENLHIIANLLLLRHRLGAIIIRNVTAIVYIETVEIVVLVKSHIIVLVVVTNRIIVVIHAAIGYHRIR